MRAVVARSIKNVGNQQFFSVKAVFAPLFAFLFFRLWQADMCAEKRTRGATPKEYKSLPNLLFAKKRSYTGFSSCATFDENIPMDPRRAHHGSSRNSIKVHVKCKKTTHVWARFRWNDTHY